MKNYIQPGNSMTFTAPTGGVVAGNFYKIGQIIVCAKTSADQTKPFVGELEGVFGCPKATGAAWGEGDLLYWDNTAKNFTKTSTGNLLAGIPGATALSGDTTGSIRLNGIAAVNS